MTALLWLVTCLLLLLADLGAAALLGGAIRLADTPSDGHPWPPLTGGQQ